MSLLGGINIVKMISYCEYEPLREAVKSNNIDFVKEFLISDKNYLDMGEGWRKIFLGEVLLLAINKGTIEMVELAMEMGADPDVRVHGEDSEIFCKSGPDIGIVNLLLKASPVKFKDSIVLRHFIEKDGIEKVKALIDIGVTVKSGDVVGAVEAGNIPLVKYLLDNGGDINDRSLNTDKEFSRTVPGELPGCDNTMSAATWLREGSFEMVNFLLENGADPEECPYDGEPPLFNACRNGNLDVIELLFKHGLNANTEYSDKSPLMTYDLNIEPHIVSFLISKGANLNFTDSCGMTALHRIFDFVSGERRISEFVSIRHAIFTKDGWIFHVDDRETAMKIRDTIKILLDAGADMDIVSRYGTTARQLHGEVMKKLDYHINLPSENS